MSIPLCDLELWSWPWTFKVKLWNSRIPRMGGSIDMGRKGCESIGCWTHYVTLIFNLTHDLGFGFLRLNFQIAIAQDWESQLTWNGRVWVRYDVGSIMQTLTCNMGLPVQWATAHTKYTSQVMGWWPAGPLMDCRFSDPPVLSFSERLVLIGQAVEKNRVDFRHMWRHCYVWVAIYCCWGYYRLLWRSQSANKFIHKFDKLPNWLVYGWTVKWIQVRCYSV